MGFLSYNREDPKDSPRMSLDKYRAINRLLLLHQ